MRHSLVHSGQDRKPKEPGFGVERLQTRKKFHLSLVKSKKGLGTGLVSAGPSTVLTLLPDPDPDEGLSPVSVWVYPGLLRHPPSSDPYLSWPTPRPPPVPLKSIGPPVVPPVTDPVRTVVGTRGSWSNTSWTPCTSWTCYTRCAVTGATVCCRTSTGPRRRSITTPWTPTGAGRRVRTYPATGLSYPGTPSTSSPPCPTPHRLSSEEEGRDPTIDCRHHRLPATGTETGWG